MTPPDIFAWPPPGPVPVPTNVTPPPHPTARIPHPSIISTNPNGLSAYALPGTAGAKRKAKVAKQLAHHITTADFCLVQESKLSPSDKTYPTFLGGVIYRNNFPNPNKRFSAGTIIMVKNSIARASFIKHTMVPGYLHMLEVTPKDPDDPPYRVINFYGQQTLDGRLAQIGCIESLDPVKYTFLGGDFNFKDKPNQTTGRYTEPPARFMTAWNRTLEKHALTLVPSDVHSFRANSHHTSQLDRFYTSYLESDHVLYAPLISTPGGDEFKALNAVDHRPMSLRFIPQDRKPRTKPFPQWLPQTTAYKKQFDELWGCVSPFTDQITCPFKTWALFKETSIAAASFALRSLNPTTPTPNQKIAIASAALRELYSSAPCPGHLRKLAKLDPALPALTPHDGSDPLPALESHLNALFAEHAEEPPDHSSHPHADTKPNFLKEARLFLPSKRNHLKGLTDKDGQLTSDPLTMAQILKVSWGKTWAARPCERDADQYLQKYGRRFLRPHLAMPSAKDVEETIKQSGNTAPGVDGIPFSLYRELSPVASPLLHQVLVALCKGVGPPKDFNLSLGVFIA